MRAARRLSAGVGASIICYGALRASTVDDRTYMSARVSGGEGPAYAMGLIADVQWADADDGWNFARTTRRCFRGALDQLKRSVDWWNLQELVAVAQLGDLIDGRNAKAGQSESALAGALAQLGRLRAPVLHVVGNHELYNFDRATLGDRLGLGAPPSYSSLRPAEGHRVLVLDTFCESINGWPEGDPRRERALRTLADNNPNDVLNDGTSWFKGMSGAAKRFVPYNGGLGKAQLAWLRTELEAAERLGEQVVILSHAILHPQACEGTTMAWDFEAALHEIHRTRCVVAVFCGHDHNGGYHLDEAGVHHVTLCSPLNEGEEGSAFGTFRSFADHFELHGPALTNLLPLGRLSEALPPVQGEPGHETMRFEFRRRSQSK